MTTSYYPFGRPDMLVVEATLDQEPDTLMYVVEFRVVYNLIGDNNRFVDDGGMFSHVATPADDHTAPVLPERNDEGWGRLGHIRLRIPSQSSALEAYNGIISSLDEYVSSKMALDDPNMVPAETYEFG